MFLEYWIIVVFIIVLGAWGEIRNYMGQLTLREAVSSQIIDNIAAQTEEEMEIQRGIGGINVMSQLLAAGVIIVNAETEIIGYNGAVYKIPSLNDMSELELNKMNALKNRYSSLDK